MSDPLADFLHACMDAFRKGTFLKCTLSQPAPAAPEGLKNIYIRPVELKKGRHMAFTWRYQTRDELHNHLPEAAEALLHRLLGKQFRAADLLTSEADWTLSLKQKTPRLLRKPPSQTMPADTRHDRVKQRLLDPAAPWLHTLGITSSSGTVLASAQDKWRQINKYLEIIDSLLRAQPLPDDAHIADMGSGKGYLTFALYDFLSRQKGLHPQVTGIELRQNLVDLCNRTAVENGFDGLRFVAEDIRDYHPERLDMLIALHACDTATDLALATGILQHAAIIVAAPCCHKQIRRDMDTANELAPILRYGILEERQAEIITDGIRALLLESEGYETKVFEFISTEHTAKNVMITAVGKHQAGNRDALEKVAALKAGFGVREQYLETLLAQRSAGKSNPSKT